MEDNGITEITFDPGYDNIVRITSDNLYAAGNTTVTITKFLHEMGQPYTQKEAIKLIESLKKCSTTQVTVDNKEILKAFNINSSTYKKIDSPLIPVRFSSEQKIKNGNLTTVIIEIMGFSPFYDIEKPINQITTYDKQVLTLFKGPRNRRYYRVLL